MKRKFLSILLTLALALSMLPTAALADLKADSPTAAAAVQLTDVDGHWAENAIRRWVENGVVQGNDGQFDPNGPLTCAQLATILANLLRLGAAGSAGFTDVKPGAWYEDAIDRCAAAGILMGNGDGTVDPDGAISRERAMVMLGRALGIRPAADPDLSKHSDEAQVSSYARGMVAALVAAGIVNGVDGDRLAPQDDINRASTMTILDKAIENYVKDNSTFVTGAGNGITLIVADDVTVNGEIGSLLVAGDDSNVSVGSGSQLGDVNITGSGSSVTIKDSGAGSVNITGDNTKVILDGADAGSISVTGDGTQLELGGDAKVGDLNVGGENTKLELGGKSEIDNVEISEGANGTTIDAGSGSTIGTVKNEAENTTVTGDGAVKNVESTTDVTVETKGTDVKNTGDADISVKGADGKESSVASGGSSSTAGTTPGTTTGGGSSSGGSSGGGSGSHNHTMVKTEAVAASCTTAGNNTYYTCSVCNKVYKDTAGTTETTVVAETISATGHQHTTDVNAKAATCTECGWNAYTICNDCEVITVGSNATIPALGHSWGAWTVMVPATEDSTGVETRECSRCGATETQAIPKLTHEHSWTLVAERPATCISTGEKAHYACSGCDAVAKYPANEDGTYTITDDTMVIEAKGHRSGDEDQENVVAATCTTEGSYDAVVYCTVCGIQLSRETKTIPATGHTFSEVWTYDAAEHWHAATCRHSEEVSGKDTHAWNSDGECACGMTAEALVYHDEGEEGTECGYETLAEALVVLHEEDTLTLCKDQTETLTIAVPCSVNLNSHSITAAEGPAVKVTLTGEWEALDNYYVWIMDTEDTGTLTSRTGSAVEADSASVCKIDADVTMTPAAGFASVVLKNGAFVETYGLEAIGGTAEVMAGDEDFARYFGENGVPFAIEAANEFGADTVKLLKDVEPGYLSIREDLTIDLNGKKIENSSTLFDVYNKLTIRDSSEERTGKVISTGGKAAYVESGAELTLESGTMETYDPIWLAGDGAVFNIKGGEVLGANEEYYEYSAVFCNGGTLNIDGGKIIGRARSGAVLLQGATVNIISGTVEQTRQYGTAILTSRNADIVNIFGGTVKATNENDCPSGAGIAAVSLPVGTLTMTGGSIDAVHKFGIALNGGTASISGGQITGHTDAVYVERGTANISGGEFRLYTDGKATMLNCENSAYSDETAKIIVTGGTFYGFDPSANPEGEGTSYVAENYKSVESDVEGVKVYTVVAEYTAEINGTKYETLADAVATAQSGDTVKLLADFSTDTTLTIPAGANLTLDLNGRTYTTSAKVGFELAYVKDSNQLPELTIRGGNIVSTFSDEKTCYAIQNYGKLTIEEGTTVTISNAKGSCVANNGTLYVEGGELDARNGKYWLNVSSTGNITYIKGGTFLGNANIATGQTVFSITGGSFSTDLSNYCEKGYSMVLDANSGLYVCGTNTQTGYTVDENGDIVISTEAGLRYFANQVNNSNTYEGKTVTLADDIELTETWTPAGYYHANGSMVFKGTFDGGGHTVRLNAGSSGGFFGATAGATIKNLTVAGNITSEQLLYIGGIVGHGSADISDCTYKGNINASTTNVGGIAGSGSFTITNCNVVGDISGSNWVGGITGNAQSGGGAYTRCNVKGTVTATQKTGDSGISAGGIVAAVSSVEQVITGCYADVVVKVRVDAAEGEENPKYDEVNCPIIGGYNVDSITADTALHIDGNSWNYEKNSNTSYPVLVKGTDTGRMIKRVTFVT